jgi:hypothetical protein
MTMEVRLLTRWGSRLQGDVVSVSDARAQALQEEGIGRIINVPKVEEPKAEEAEGPKAKKK